MPALRAVVARVVSELGSETEEILVNNAGIIRRAAALDFSAEDWDDAR